MHALQLTVEIVAHRRVINPVFGVGISLLLVRYELPRQAGAVSALLDVPLSVSPVVVGLALVLVYNGRDGWFGPTLEANGFQVIFASPGMVMATCFVALPLVIREVVPVLEEIGDDQEQAARSLGANAAQTFRRITLPAIKWARRLRRRAEPGPLARRVRRRQDRVRQRRRPHPDRDRWWSSRSTRTSTQATAYAVRFLLALVAVACIIVVSLLRPKEDRS